MIPDRQAAHEIQKIVEFALGQGLLLVRGYGEMAQKVIAGDISQVKSYAWEIEMAQFQNG